jgi:hypothetical protein
MALRVLNMPALNYSYHAATIPFAAYVQRPAPTHSTSTFEHFLDLPAELQLRICKFCPAPTLFNLMRTCSRLRPEAANCFWSNEDTWYHVDCKFILDHHGFPGPALHCPHFARRVQQVEVAFVKMRGQFKHNPQLSGRSITTIENQIRVFWESFSSAFPSAKRVVLIDDSTWIGTGSPNSPFVELMEACPRGVQPYLSTLEFDRRPDILLEARKLYVMRKGTGDTWELVYNPWLRDRVEMPPKVFTGYIGEIQRMEWRGLSIDALAMAIKEQRLQALEKTLPFVCPHPDCTVEIAQKGDWAAHDRSHGSINNNYELPQRFCVDCIPQDIHESLVEAEDSNRIARDDLKAEIQEMLAGWGKPGTEQRRRVEDAISAQLENDPLSKYSSSARTMYIDRITYWE